MRHIVLLNKLFFISILSFPILFLGIFVSISNASDHNYTIIKAKSSKNIVIDGQLDEHIWQTIDPITDFTQMEPFEGTPISERTEAYVFYDDEYKR